jgi:hypothetical protein
MKSEIKKIEGLPLKYRGFTIRQDTKSIPVKHSFNPCLDFDKIALLSHLCISKDLEDPIYSDDFTSRKVLLGGFGLSDRKFKTITAAKKEIDSILSLGYCWMTLTPREVKYVKENLDIKQLV